jgi:hypothetical protein
MCFPLKGMSLALQHMLSSSFFAWELRPMCKSRPIFVGAATRHPCSSHLARSEHFA